MCFISDPLVTKLYLKEDSVKQSIFLDCKAEREFKVAEETFFSTESYLGEKYLLHTNPANLNSYCSFASIHCKEKDGDWYLYL